MHNLREAAHAVLIGSLCGTPAIRTASKNSRTHGNKREKIF